MFSVYPSNAHVLEPWSQACMCSGGESLGGGIQWEVIRPSVALSLGEINEVPIRPYLVLKRRDFCKE